LDEEKLIEIALKHKTILTLEDGCLAGGFGSAIVEFYASQVSKIPIERLGIPDTFISHGSIDVLQDLAGISPEKIAEKLNFLLLY